MELTERQLDLLKEIGNIGTGNAATALSTLVNKKVEISVPSAQVVPISKLLFMFENPEDIVVGVRMSVSGDLKMDVLLILDRPTTRRIITDLLGNPCEDITQLDELTASALKEIGNIMCGSYITALAEFTEFYLDPTPPELTIDMLAAIVAEAVLERYYEFEENVVVVETQISMEGVQSITSYMFLIPGKDCLDKIFKKVGIA
ncbi:CheY-P phosphatase CheC [Pseudothermotoga thermarum]|uniref:CheC, inhibitor of MCP methylation n=1 Tax=Pseudothermotoga thermarum DSM 5069 TaxID=688269 RepID=F7YXZ0_9THEM|nr:CheY-P phosphatase CheC [Pseudothermotoga thermarum]AEH50789.1 CheC, inhibitor of MCP methylation [Pseudothermotoga thermarum DSM 5069]